MGIGPDDLPPDPFGESGMAQLICPCTSESFHFVYTPTTVRAICAACKTIGGEWPRQGLDAKAVPPIPGPERPHPDVDYGWPELPGQGAAAHTFVPGGCDGLHPLGPCPPPPEAIRPTGILPGVPDIVRPGQRILEPGQAQVGSGWVGPETGHPYPPLPDAVRPREPDPAMSPPPLPAFSAGMCNVYLEGGPYDDQITWVMAGGEAGSAEFAVAGVPGYWVSTSRVHDGRVVYTYRGASDG
jgi:hypothetical protein